VEELEEVKKAQWMGIKKAISIIESLESAVFDSASFTKVEHSNFTISSSES